MEEVKVRAMVASLKERSLKREDVLLLDFASLLEELIWPSEAEEAEAPPAPPLEPTPPAGQE